MKLLSTSEYTVAHNFLFRGGYLTRHFGRPEKGFHALQLEMTQTNYMDDFEEEYDEDKAIRMRKLLRNLLTQLAQKLKDL